MSDTTPRREIVVRTEERVARLLEDGGLVLPQRYAWQNALKVAWLQLQDAEIQHGERKGQKVLDVVTERSVANALLDMVVQGLNVGAKQGYFIPYGSTLTFQRSYFGSIAVAKRVAGVRDVRALPIYAGDEVELEVMHGYRLVSSHRQTFESIRDGTLAGAYAIVEFVLRPDVGELEDDEPIRPDHVEIMTIEEIKTSWRQSRGYKFKPESSTHAAFPEAMALRTVIQRALKPLINAASDDYLFLDAFNREPEHAVEQDLDAELEDANTIDVDVALEAPREDEQLDEEAEVELEVVEEEPAPEAEDDEISRLFPEKPGF